MPPASATGAVRIAFLMLMNAGGIDVPDERGPVRAGDDGLPRGLAAQPALPGLVDLRQPDVRRGARVDHARARRARCPTASRPAGTSSSAPRSPASTRAPTQPSVSLSIFMRGGPGAMKGADGFDALGFTGTPGSMRSPDMEMFELSTPHFMEQYEYLPDSAGAGEWRGGLGTVSRWRFYGIDELGVTIGDDVASRGRRPGARALRRRAGGAERAAAPLPRRHRQGLGLEGDRLRHPRGHDLRGAATAAAAATATRAGATRGRSFEEVRDGLLSAEKARASYGVAIARRRTRPRASTRRETARLRGGCMSYRIGIDVGGTFTDFLVIGDDGTRLVHKTSSTPGDPSLGLVTGLEEIAARPARSLERVPRRGRADRPRHDRHHERAADPPRRAHRPALHRGLPRHARAARRDRARRRTTTGCSRPSRSCRATCGSASSERTDYKGDEVTRARRGRASARPAAACSPTTASRRSRSRSCTRRPSPRTSGARSSSAAS